MGRVRRALASDHLAGWAFVAPSVILVLVFGLYPIVSGFVLSLQRAGLLIPTREFVGLHNYASIMHDPRAIEAAKHAVFYTTAFVPISVLGALMLAVALNRKIRFIKFYRLAVFIPVVTSTIATGIMFLWVFDKNFGLANYLLEKVGLGPFGFFESVSGALPSLVAMTVWGWLGFDVIVYLAALQGIPYELMEAAAMDGASSGSVFRTITWPLLGPATLLLVVWSSISALQLFDEVYFVTNGGPLGATNMPVFYVFVLAFRQGIGYPLAGYAAAIAYVLFVAILLLTLVQFWMGRRVVHYSA
jgi:multiple sugar transport system permease protein